MRVIPTYKTGPWDMYEVENLVKVYNIVHFIEEAHTHNEFVFWHNVSNHLFKLGIYRNAESCKEKVWHTKIIWDEYLCINVRLRWAKAGVAEVRCNLMLVAVDTQLYVSLLHVCSCCVFSRRRS